MQPQGEWSFGPQPHQGQAPRLPRARRYRFDVGFGERTWISAWLSWCCRNEKESEGQRDTRVVFKAEIFISPALPDNYIVNHSSKKRAISLLPSLINYLYSFPVILWMCDVVAVLQHEAESLWCKECSVPRQMAESLSHICFRFAFDIWDFWLHSLASLEKKDHPSQPSHNCFHLGPTSFKNIRSYWFALYCTVQNLL